MEDAKATVDYYMETEGIQSTIFPVERHYIVKSEPNKKLLENVNYNVT